MCDFKPGDEVVCVDDRPCYRGIVGPIKGHTYVVEGFDESRGDGVGLIISGLAHAYDGDGLTVGWAPSRFRKVQRRDLSAWLKTSIGDTDKLDKPRRASKKERA